MSEIKNVTYLISNLFRIYVLYRFSNAFFKSKRVQNKFIILGFAGFYIINSLLYLTNQTILINILSNVGLFFVVSFMYNSAVSVRLLVSLLVYSVSVFIDIVAFSLENAMHIKSIAVSSGTVTALLMFMTELFYEYYIVNPGENKELKIKQLLLILFIPLGSIFIGLKSMKNADKNYLIESAVLLAINVIVFYMYEALRKAEKEKYEKIILQEQNLSYENQIKLRNDSENKIRMLKHDMKNHIYKIKDMAEKVNDDGVVEYTRSMIKSINNVHELCDSGNYDVDSIVNLKLSKAEDMGTDVHINIKIPRKLNIDSFDLNRILGNLLDNVLEALEKVDKKIVYFEMIYEKGVVNICIRNTFNGQLRISEENKLFSMKRNTLNSPHGLGLKSVEETLEKYDGCFEYEIEKNVFSIYAVLYEN